MAKSPNAFRTISEASEIVGSPQHVLRFWETKFTFIRPVKRAGARRFYRPEDIAVLKGVRRLLNDEGLTIKGVQRLFKDQGLARIAAYGDSETPVDLVAPPSPGAAAVADNDAGDKATTGHMTDAGTTAQVLDVIADLDAARKKLNAVIAG